MWRWGRRRGLVRGRVGLGLGLVVWRWGRRRGLVRVRVRVGVGVSGVALGWEERRAQQG